MSNDADEVKAARANRILEAIRSLRNTPESTSPVQPENEDPEQTRRRAFREGAYDAGIALDHKDHS